MSITQKLAAFIICTLLFSCESSQKSTLIVERPNFLWITFEDSSPYGFNCYGNTQIETPVVNTFAKKSIQYTRASSTAPHCSPARSTLITGSFATTFGMDVHREDYHTPTDIFYPSILRKNGYFCTNNYKTDYNTTLDDASLWDENGQNASYWSPKRKPDQPFFAIFNSSATHMGRMRTITIENRGHYKDLGIDPETLELPAHVPNLPEVRSDFAVHLESYIGVDQWLGNFLNDLKARGLDENTIVFFYSDHGGCLPRGKGFPFETGLQVPLLVHVPKKWQDKFNVHPGSTEDRLVGFEDFAPTILSLAGIEIPKFMQGKAFLGPNTETEKAYQFGFRTNQENYHYDPARTVSDGRFKYIRNYIPHKPYALRNIYQWGMPANLAWDAEMLAGKIKNPEWRQPYAPKGPELLFDLNDDPYELNNLANDPKYARKLAELRNAVSNHIRSTKDLGFFVRDSRKKEGGLYQWVNTTNFPLEKLYHAAELASIASIDDISELSALLKSQHAEIRFWSACGFANLSARGDLKTVPTALKNAINDPEDYVSTMATEALCYTSSESKYLELLLERFAQNNNPAYSALETLTWYPEQKQRLMAYADQLEQLLQKNEDKADNRMSVYLKIRSLLVNLERLNVSELYPKEQVETGKQLNIKSRQFSYPKGIITTK